MARVPIDVACCIHGGIAIGNGDTGLASRDGAIHNRETLRRKGGAEIRPSAGRSFKARLFYAPALKRFLTNTWYSLVTRFDRQADVRVMNYGFAVPEGPKLPLEVGDEAERYPLQLYHHVATAIPIEGMDVLEVSCGRGGGASYIARRLHPKSVVAVDANWPAIAFDRKHYKAIRNLRFQVADAQHLPFETSGFDVVINIESAHHYPRIDVFLAEVRRVLRPGGHLLLACHDETGANGILRTALQSSGLIERSVDDITGNVVAALDLDTSRRQSLAKEICPWFLADLGREFAGVRGSEFYNGLASGKWPYQLFVYRKPP
jgi:ubiquinone/menaquinone biosynthesis C-methylase UbiE